MSTFTIDYYEYRLLKEADWPSLVERHFWNPYTISRKGVSVQFRSSLPKFVARTWQMGWLNLRKWKIWHCQKWQKD